MVGYANDRLLVYFLISRSSQKFTNIDRDPRVSLTIGIDHDEPQDIEGLSIAAYASQVTDSEQREKGYRLLLNRYPRWSLFPKPDWREAAIMRAAPRMVTIIDYSKGFGHSDIITVTGPDIVDMQPARPDNWGLVPGARDDRSSRA